MARTPRGPDATARRRSPPRHQGHEVARAQKEVEDVPQDDEQMAPGLATPTIGAKWAPEDEQWTRGVVTLLIVACFLLTVAISGIALLTQAAQVRDVVTFLNVVLTPTGIVVGYYFGRRSTSRH